jgi:hypothetical protein
MILELRAIICWTFAYYSSPFVSAGDTFQDLPRLPETADSNETYIYKNAE